MDDSMREVRLSDAERDVVIDQLREASAEGRITLDEFGDRTRQVYDAKFASQLQQLTSDLPEPVDAPSITNQSAAPSRQSDRKRRWFLMLMGGTTRSGHFDPGQSTIAVTVMGGQEIDLTEVQADTVSLTAITVMGGTDIIVPDGCRVDLGGFMFWGGMEQDTAAPGDSSMVVKIRAIGTMGGCTVRNLTDKERAKRNR